MSEYRQRWEEVCNLACVQYGLVERRQVTEHLSKAEIDTRVRRGDLVRAARCVWRLPGAPRTWRQRLLTACLSVGSPAYAYGITAARLWALDGIAPSRENEPVEVAVTPRCSGKNRPGIIVHRLKLADTDLTSHLRIPVTTPIRTLVDLAGLIETDLLSRVTDDALRQGVLKPADLAALQVARPRAIKRIATRRLETGASDSEWEDRVYGWIVDAGLPPPVRQYQLSLETQVAILDMAYPAEQVGIEFDGFEYHKGRGRFDRDRERTSELSAAGWRMIVVTSAHKKMRVVDRIRRALEQGGP